MARKTERLEIRLEPEHKELIEKAAAAAGQVVSQFVVSTTLRGAHEVLGQSSVTTLVEKDREAFLRIMDSDPAPAPALKAAFERHPEKPE
jgi:uncharacterized protein (DUF1778 family)